MIEAALSVASSILIAVLTAVINRRITKMEQRQDERDRASKAEAERREEIRRAEHSCAAAVARAQLVTMADSYQDKGYFPFEDRRAFDELYTAYEAMGENGLIQETVARARTLPMRPPQEPAAKGVGND